MDPGLSPVLRELWLAFVAHSRLLEPASIRCETRVCLSSSGTDVAFSARNLALKHSCGQPSAAAA